MVDGVAVDVDANIGADLTFDGDGRGDSRPCTVVAVAVVVVDIVLVDAHDEQGCRPRTLFVLTAYGNSHAELAGERL